MSDEQPGAEQQGQSAQPQPPAGDRWGDPITPERAATLKALADQQRVWTAAPDHQGRASYFKDIRLTGADVFWLAAYALAGPEGDVAATQERLRTARDRSEYDTDLSALHLEGANLFGAHLERANLRAAHLEGANLFGAHLEGAYLRAARLERANLFEAHLERAILWQARLEGATLVGAHLEGAYLYQAHLEGANLRGARLERANLEEAHLEGAYLFGADLEGADLIAAHLEGAYLYQAHLEGANLGWARLERANLRSAWLDSKTVLSSALLDDQTRLGDIQWSGVGAVNLTQLDWSRVPRLGDETTLKRDATANDYEAAVRAYRQLAAQLRAQGMSEVADRFLYRAQVVQRRMLRKRRQVGRWFGTWLLDAVSGHGYKPMRSIFTYVLVVLAFAAVYFAIGGAHGQPLGWNEALVVSLTAFHGRGFFATAFQPGDPQAALAAVEAVFGLLIEITFIATFTQRFFAR